MFTSKATYSLGTRQEALASNQTLLSYKFGGNAHSECDTELRQSQMSAFAHRGGVTFSIGPRSSGNGPGTQARLVFTAAHNSITALLYMQKRLLELLEISHPAIQDNKEL